MTTSETITDSEAILDDGASKGPRAISKDDAYHVLQNPRRRAALRYLLERDADQRHGLSDLAEAVAAWEHDTTRERLTSTERSRVYISLCQAHLPKLDDYGVVEYDKDRGHVEATPLVDVFDPFLENGLDNDRYYLVEDANRQKPTGITRTVRSLFGP